MAATIATATLVLTGVLSAFTTFTAALRPADFAKRLGMTINNPGGINEIRSQYAGFFLAAAIACAAGLSGFIARQEALIVVAVIFGGLFVGRVFSLILNKGLSGYGQTIRALCVIDTVGLALCITSIVTES